MSLKKVYLGNMGPFQYDPNQYYQDSGQLIQGIRVEDQLSVEGTPTLSTHVVRLSDLTATYITATQVADIDDPSSELGAIDGTEGKLIFCHEDMAGMNNGTLYVWDPSVVGGLATPYACAAKNTGKWLAMAGRYSGQGINYGGNIVALAGAFSGTLSAGATTLANLEITQGLVVNNGKGLFDSKFGSVASTDALMVDASADEVSTAVPFIAKSTLVCMGAAQFENTVIVNSGFGDTPFVVRKKTSGTTFTVNPTDNRVGVGLATPTVEFEVAGSAIIQQDATFNKSVVVNAGLSGTESLEVKKNTSGSAFFVNAATGKVGIGTDSPTNILDVIGSAYVSGNCIFDGAVAVNVAKGKGGLTVWQESSGVTLFVDTDNGKVGIGTATPSALLDVGGEIYAAGKLLSSDVDAGGYGLIITGKAAIGNALECNKGGFMTEGFIVNSGKGANDFVVHGDSVDNIIITDGATNKTTISNALTLQGPAGAGTLVWLVKNLPTAAAGLASGQVWNNSGVLTVVA